MSTSAPFSNIIVQHQPTHLPQDIPPAAPPPPPPPPPPPADTTESQQTDQALADYQAAQESLATAQQMAAQGQAAGLVEGHEGFLIQNVATAETGLQDAVDAEIDALQQADPSLDDQAAGDAIVARYDGHPQQADVEQAVQATVVNRLVDGTLENVDTSNGPAQSLQDLDVALAQLPPEVREQVLADPRVQELVTAAADYVTEPLAPYQTSSDDLPADHQQPVLDAMQRLAYATAGLSPELAAQLVEASLTDFEQVQETLFQDYPISIYPHSLTGDGLNEAVAIASAVATADGGQELISRLIDLHGDSSWDRALQGIDLSNPMYSVDGTTIGPALFVELERRGIGLTPNGESAVQYALGEIQSGINGPVQDHAEDYYGLIETLAFAQQMRPMFDSQEDYDAALNTLMTQELGADWQDQIAAQEAVLAEDGSRLLTQMQQLMALPADHPQRAAVDDYVRGVLDDPAAQLAISQALRSNPQLASGNGGDMLLELFATPDLGATGQALAAEYANLYISTHTGAAIAGVDPSDPASVQAVQEQITALDNPHLAAALGVEQGDLSSALAALNQMIPSLGTSDAQLASAQSVLNSTLEGIPGFTSDDPAGQIVRGLAVSATGSAVINQEGLDIDDPRVESLLDVAIGNLDFLKGSNLTAKALIGVAVNASVLQGGTFIANYGLGNTLTGRLFGAVSIAGDTWNAIQAFGDGDTAEGALHAVAAGGTLVGLLGAGSWAGPVGWAVAAIAYIGLGFVANAEHNNRFETEEMRNFLAASGLSDDAAAELFNTTGNAVSPVPFLLHYAEGHGLDTEQAIAWLNQLAADGQLGGVVELAHRTIDANDNDATGLPATHASDAQVTQEFENAGNPVGYAITLEPASLAQVDLVLEFFDIPLPG